MGLSHLSSVPFSGGIYTYIDAFLFSEVPCCALALTTSLMKRVHSSVEPATGNHGGPNSPALPYSCSAINKGIMVPSENLDSV